MGSLRRTSSSRKPHPSPSSSVLGLLSLLLLLAPPLPISGALVNKADYGVMMQLKARWIGKVPDLKTWTATNDCTKWLRVACDGDRIAGLYFMKDGLGGPFPTVILKLTSLRHFYADGNGFTGVIPADISKLQSLEVLRLNGNNLHGRLPSSIGSLKRLYKFYVRGNGNLVGTIPKTWANINLQEAYFEGNKFSGPLPTVICKWSYLQMLRMGSNKWSGGIPKCFSKLKALRNMYFDEIGSQFNGRFPRFIGQMTSLQMLFFNGNGMRGPIPPSIGKLQNLNTLFISGNYFTGPLPKTFGQLKNIQSIVMEFNDMDGSIPSEFGQMTSLQRLLLDNNKITGTIPPTLGNLRQLTILLLEGNGLYGTIPPEIPKNLNKLVQFNVESNQLSGSPPTIWGSTSLLQINIRSNFFIGGVNYRTTAGRLVCPPLTISSWVHSSSAFNCLSKPASCGTSYTEPQRRKSDCTGFCGANGPRGPCNGNGICRFIFKKGKRKAQCICNKGRKRTRNGLGCK